MITSKHLSISIVLLGISIFCTAQEVKIEFSYDKPNNSLTLAAGAADELAAPPPQPARKVNLVGAILF